MPSAIFRLGKSTSLSGPWTWGAYDAAITADASDYIKAELQSTAGVDVIGVTLPSADPTTLAAGVPTVTTDQATKTATFRLAAALGRSINVKVQINRGIDANAQTIAGYTKSLQVNVLTDTGVAVIAVGESDEYSREYGYTQKINAAIELAGSSGVPPVNRWIDTVDSGTTPADCLRQTPGAEGDIVQVQGYWAVGDGGARIFEWVGTSTLTEDGIDNIVPSAAARGDATVGAGWRSVDRSYYRPQFAGICDGDTATARDADWLRLYGAINGATAPVILEFPPGTYIHGVTFPAFNFAGLVASNVVLHPAVPLTVRGYGATIKTRAGTRYTRDLDNNRLCSAHGLLFYNCDNLTVEGLDLDGNAANLSYSEAGTLVGGQRIASEEAAACGLMLWACRDVVIRDVKAHDYATDGFFIHSDTAWPATDANLRSERVTMTNCTSSRNARVAITVAAVRGMSITGCRFTCDRADLARLYPWQNAIDIEPDNWEGWHIEGDLKDQLASSLDGSYGLLLYGWENVAGGKLYARLTIPAGNATLYLYSDAGYTTPVAHGALVGNTGGTITLAADGGSGITGECGIKTGATAADGVVTEPWRDIDGVEITGCYFGPGMGNVVNGVGKAWHVYNVNIRDCLIEADAEARSAIQVISPEVHFWSTRVLGAAITNAQMTDCAVELDGVRCIPSIVDPGTGLPYYTTTPSAVAFGILDWHYKPTLWERCAFSVRDRSVDTVLAYFTGANSASTGNARRLTLKDCRAEHWNTTTTFSRAMTVYGDVWIDGIRQHSDALRVVYLVSNYGGFAIDPFAIGAELESDSSAWNYSCLPVDPEYPRPHPYAKRVGVHKHMHAAAAPAADAWHLLTAGDVCWNTAGDPIGWRFNGATWDEITTGTTGSQRWTALTPTTDFATTAASTSQITMVTDTRASVRPRVPIRVLDTTGYWSYTGWVPTWTISSHALTGVDSGLLLSDGAITIDMVDVGGGEYRLDVYAGETVTDAFLVGHTANFSTTGAKTILPDNSSGIGGTITLAGTFGEFSARMYFYKWLIVNSNIGTALHLYGSPLGTGAGAIAEMWYGTPEMVDREHITFEGPSFALSADTTLVLNFKRDAIMNDGPRKRIVQLKCWHHTASGTHPKINVRTDTGGDVDDKVCSSNAGDGLTLTAAQTWYSTTVDVNAIATLWDSGKDLEVTTTAGGQTEPLDCDLAVDAVWVLE